MTASSRGCTPLFLNPSAIGAESQREEIQRTQGQQGQRRIHISESVLLAHLRCILPSQRCRIGIKASPQGLHRTVVSVYIQPCPVVKSMSPPRDINDATQTKRRRSFPRSKPGSCKKPRPLFRPSQSIARR